MQPNSNNVTVATRVLTGGLILGAISLFSTLVLNTPIHAFNLAALVSVMAYPIILFAD